LVPCLESVRPLALALLYSGNLEKYMANLRNGFVLRGGCGGNNNGTKKTAF
jgi:hypothetical protein